MVKSVITFGSLFSGIGGFDLGFERSGMECKWQVEKDTFCQKILKKHWPNVERYIDVRDCGKHNLETVDLICGGFPCQDVSISGRRRGLAGSRSGLWFEFYRVLEELRPRWVVIENVPGLLSSGGGRDFATILQGLAKLRYGVAWRIFDSQNFGVPQRRRRVFIVGCFRGRSITKILFESEHSFLETAQRKVVSNTLMAQGTVNKSGSGGGGIVIGSLKARGVATTSSIAFVGETVSSNSDTNGMRRASGISHWMDNSLKLDEDGKRERIDQFEGHFDQHRYKALGNAVTVPVVEWIGKRIVVEEGNKA